MPASVARVKTGSREVDQLQSNIISKLNPLLTEPLLGGHVIQNQALKAGANSLPHGLDYELQGWLLTRVQGPATIYDTQASNPTPTKTLNLVSSADVLVNIYVF